MSETAGTYTTGPEGHAKHGPSSLRAKELCPRWTNSGGTSAAAEEGTAMHAAAETGNLTGLTPEQAAQVADALAYVEDLKQIESLGGAVAVVELKETQLDVAGLTWGTADRVLICDGGRHAHLVDFKFGRNDVDDAKTNLQGWAYAVGVFTGWGGVQAVAVHFVVPRRDSKHTATFQRSQMPGMVARIAAVIERAESSDLGQEHPDTKNCTYCGNKATCPALAGKALEIAKGAGMEVPSILDPAAITDPRQLAQCLTLVPSIAAWCDAIKAAALDRTRNGEVLPGYELAHRSGKRMVKDLLPCWEVLNGEFGVELDQFLPACSISITELENQVKAKAEKGKGAETLRTLNKRFAELGMVTTAPDIEYLKKSK